MKKKGGAIQSHEKNKLRKSDFEAAAKAQELNKGKVPIRIDRKTTMYVTKSEYEYHVRNFRLNQARKPENQEKVKYLEKKGWKMQTDGLWKNRSQFIIREFETALSISKYYDPITR